MKSYKLQGGTIICDDGLNDTVASAFKTDNTMEGISTEELADELKRRTEKMSRDNAMCTERYNELAVKYGKAIDENVRLKRGEEERKRLKVRCEMLEEEASELRGSVSRLKNRERELEDKLERMKNMGRTDYCAMYHDELARNASLERENITMLSVIAAKEKEAENMIDTMISWYDSRCAPGSEERMRFKLMCMEKLADRLTKEQRQKLADFDKRDKDTRATTINVSGGGQYIERVDRQEAAPRWRMMR